jgi:NAD(P)-dependent dehydrogenase (short-subunit alcohol dehydrogenase family)
MRLRDKVAIITGGGRGIGRATVEAYAREGAHVVIAEKDARIGEEVAAALRATGHSVIAIPTDVTHPDSVAELVRRVLQERARIDILVANAGINVFSEPLAMTMEQWKRCFSVDLDGVWNSARAVLPAMLDQQNGSIIAIASVHSFNIIPHCFPYPVAKHAVVGLVRALAIEYATQGIRVNAIAPGYIETQLVRDHWASFPDPEAERRRAYALHPPGRIGRPEEVAMTAVFLGSDEAPFINAATLVIDGGRSVLYHE